MVQSNRWVRSPVLWIPLLMLGLVPSGWSKYDDTLFLKNGDRLLGDVKELSRDMLRYKTDALGTVYIRWEEIQSLETDKTLRIELKNGNRLVGSIRRSDTPDHLTVSTRRTDLIYDFDELVAMVPLKQQRSWIQRIEGSASFGLNGTKGSNTVQWNLGANALYRGENFELSSRLDSIVTDKSDDTSSERVNFFNTYRRLTSNRWFWNILAQYDRNDELGIDDRYSVGGGYGRYFLRSNQWELIGNAGLVASREFRPDGLTSQLEAFVSGGVSIFQHVFPKTDINTTLTVLPSLSQSGRLRSNIDLALKREFIEDLSLDLSIYYSTDNGSPDESGRNDWGVVTSLGYSF